MQLHRISVSRDALLGMPERERNFVIATGHLLNELNVLNKIFYRCSHYQTDDPIIRKAQSTQSLCMAKVLAGKLAVGWEMLRNFYFQTRLSQEYDSLLSADALEARQELGRYFGRGSNIISAIRNQYAFHYNPKQFSDALAAPSEDEGWEMFLTEQSGNSLYFFSEIVIGHGLLEHINPDSHQAAMDALINDITFIGGRFIRFLTGCLIVISKRYLVDQDCNLPIETIDIENPPALDEVQIPFFVLRPNEREKSSI